MGCCVQARIENPSPVHVLSCLKYDSPGFHAIKKPARFPDTLHRYTIRHRGTNALMCLFVYGLCCDYQSRPRCLNAVFHSMNVECNDNAARRWKKSGFGNSDRMQEKISGSFFYCLNHIPNETRPGYPVPSFLYSGKCVPGGHCPSLPGSPNSIH